MKLDLDTLRLYLGKRIVYKRKPFGSGKEYYITDGMLEAYTADGEYVKIGGDWSNVDRIDLVSSWDTVFVAPVSPESLRGVSSAY